MAKGLDLGQQIGPLPLGAWIAVVGGGLAIAYLSRNSAASEEPEIVEDTGSPEGVGEGPGWQYVPPTENNSGEEEQEYASNEAWGQAAINWLIAQGYQPGISSSAITKALAGGEDTGGNKMSAQEWSLWSLALRELGSPPYPVNVSPPTVGTPTTPPSENPWKPVKPPVNRPPAPKPTPKPSPAPSGSTKPRYYVYKSVRGDTLSGIAVKTNKKYGLSNSWQEIYNFNLKYRSAAARAVIRARGPNLFYAGTTWWIPR